MKDTGIIASYLLSLVSKINNLEHTSHIKLVKDLDSNRVNDLLINKTKAVYLFDNLLKFHDRDKKFEIQGHLLKVMTYKNYIVDLANISDKKLLYHFAKEMYFNIRALGNKSNRLESPIRLLKSPANMASGICTKILPENPIELYDRMKLLEEKKSGNNSYIMNEEIVAVADKLLEYKCMFIKQHSLHKYLN